MRHTMRSDDADAGADPGRGRARVRRRPRRDGPARPRAVAGLVPRPAAPRRRRARSSAACSTPSPPSIPTADDLLDFCRAENARIEAFCRERDLIGLADEPLEIRWTPVFLRAFGGAMLVVAGSARQGPEGVLRDHPDARRLDRGAARVEPARGQRPDAPAADDPRGGPRPLPPGRLRQPLPVARPGDLRERPVRRGLGRLRDPGDDGRRATARTTRRCC